MKQLSFDDLMADEDDFGITEWEDLTPTGRWFLKGIHPGSPRERRLNPYLKLMRELRREQQERFSPARKLGDK